MPHSRVSWQCNVQCILKEKNPLFYNFITINAINYYWMLMKTVNNRHHKGIFQGKVLGIFERANREGIICSICPAL